MLLTPRRIGEGTRQVSLEGVMLWQFLKDDAGQDLVEYSLLLAFVCLASAALFINAGNSLAGIWTQTNTVVSNANSVAQTTAS